MSTINPFRRTPNMTMVWLFIGALLVLVAVKVVHVLVLVFLAVLIGIYLSAITDVIEYRLRWPRWAGLTVAVIGTVAALTGIGVLLLPPVINQTQELLSGLPSTLSDIQGVLARWANQYPWLSGTQMADPTSGVLATTVATFTGFLRTQFFGYAWAGGELFIEIFAMIVMALYLARNPRLYRDGIVAMVTPRYRELATRVLEDAGSTLRAWVVGQLLAMVVLAILTAIGLYALGVTYWLTFGIFTGLVAVVPFFGTLVSTALPALFVVGSGDWLKVFLVLMLGVVVHLVEANFVVPRIMERQISLPPVLTIASVLLMGTLLGPIGLIVAVPLLALTLVLGRHILIGEIYGDVEREPMTVLRPVDELPRVDASLAEERPVSPRTAAGGAAPQLP